jgi:hypothetical protein
MRQRQPPPRRGRLSSITIRARPWWGRADYTFRVSPYQARRFRDTGTVGVGDANGRVLASHTLRSSNIDPPLHDTCTGTTVGVYAGCTINVHFTPTIPGTRRTTLVIADSLVGSPQRVPLSRGE